MKIKLKVEKEVEIATIEVSANVRCWGDTTIDGVEDTDGSLVPCRDDDCWCPIIDIETGIIQNWMQGAKASIHYKVCDGCAFKILAVDNEVIFTREDGYVPKLLCPKERGYGDYIIMDIDENGQIENWDKTKINLIFDEDD
jgi:hypothetical protein